MAVSEKWMVYAKRADFQALGARLGVDQVTARVLVNRDIPEEAMQRFLHPSLSDLHDPHLLKDVEKAVGLLKKAVEEKQKIRIIGDYDIDGISSTYILHQALLRVGADADYAIPHRITDGYGVNPAMVEKAKEDGISLIITCDNGIAAFEAVERAKKLGLTVIVTDHHEIPYEEEDAEKSMDATGQASSPVRKEKLPPADAVVNPHRTDCRYPFSNICGAVVAWKLVFVLYESFAVPTEEAHRFLENAAFATVGDVMELMDENRSIVALGLKALMQTENTGMRALLRETGLKDETLSSYHIGFVLGPCFNASGRLDTATLAIELLEEQDEEKAAVRAAMLRELNEERKAMTIEGDERVFSAIEDKGMAEEPVLIVYVPGLHESLAGIVAGHVKDRYYRPTFVLTDSENGDLKGSGRSIPGYPMFDRLVECSEYLTKFGGHPMAAGLSLKKESLEAFRESMIKNAKLSEDDLVRKVMIDVPMPLSYVSEDVVRQMDLLEPFGNGNEKPLFADKGIEVIRLSEIGKSKQFLRFTFLLQNGLTMVGLLFHDCDRFREELSNEYGEGTFRELLLGRRKGVTLRFTYYPQINEYHGDTSLQVILSQVVL